jgi:hypothetical protein
MFIWGTQSGPAASGVPPVVHLVPSPGCYRTWVEWQVTLLSLYCQARSKPKTKGKTMGQLLAAAQPGATRHAAVAPQSQPPQSTSFRFELRSFDADVEVQLPPLGSPVASVP